MSKTKSKRQQATIRSGSPDALDPHMFYEYAYDERFKHAVGLEWYLYRLMPRSVITSFAIAIDPFSGLKQKRSNIAPTSRRRTRRRMSVLDQRKVVLDTYYEQSFAKVGGGLGCHLPEMNTTSSSTHTTQTLISQANNVQEMLDSTVRLRPFGVEFNEVYSFDYTLNSPPRTVTQFRYSYVNAGRGPNNCIGDDKSIVRQTRIRRIVPTAARFNTADTTTIKNLQLSRCNALIAANVLAMFNSAMPDKRDYTLFRNLVELKDLPRSVESLKQTALDLWNATASLRSSQLRFKIFDLRSLPKDIPTEWLSYHFGWKQTYRDIMDLLNLPATMSKRFNYLNRKISNRQHLRSNRTVTTSVIPCPVSFLYDTVDIESTGSTTSSYSDTVHLSLVLGHSLEFPDLLQVRLNERSLSDKIGLSPTPLDLYNLIPWSWLVDWFTGADQYVEAIQRIGSDRKLIDYGFISAKCIGTVETTFRSESSDISSGSLSGTAGSGSWNNVTVRKNNHVSSCTLTTVVRKDITKSLTGIESTAEPSKLTGYRSSILSALLLQRTKVGR